MVAPSVPDHGPAMPSDLDGEQGAVGGVGVSDRTYRHQAPTVSFKGSIQVGNERQDVRSERKRKRQSRERREVAAGHGEEDFVGTSVSSEARGHRERRKKRKDRKRRTENRSAHQDATEIGKEGNIQREEGQNRDGADEQTRIHEDNGDGIYVNTDLPESREFVIPVVARRREMNEVV